MSWSKGVKISHAAWDQQTRCQNKQIHKEATAKEMHGQSQTLSSSRRTKCCWSPLILWKHSQGCEYIPWLGKNCFIQQVSENWMCWKQFSARTRMEHHARIQDETLVCFWDFYITTAFCRIARSSSLCSVAISGPGFLDLQKFLTDNSAAPFSFDRSGKFNSPALPCHCSVYNPHVKACFQID